MSSFVSVKGPSIMVRLPPENLMRVPLELGWRPAASRRTPAFISSSLYLPMADRSSSLGILPASESLLAFTIIMNRMVLSPCGSDSELALGRFQPRARPRPIWQRTKGCQIDTTERPFLGLLCHAARIGSFGRGHPA